MRALLDRYDELFGIHDEPAVQACLGVRNARRHVGEPEKDAGTGVRRAPGRDEDALGASGVDSAGHGRGRKA
ncbi:hypothetical protein JOC24_003807 [Streptomyces sp. HB132]|nr:hypothetical protein [Streptomyces sp. HB132]